MKFGLIDEMEKANWAEVKLNAEWSFISISPNARKDKANSEIKTFNKSFDLWRWAIKERQNEWRQIPINNNKLTAANQSWINPIN